MSQPPLRRRWHNKPVIVEDVSYVPLATAARQSGINAPTLKKWALRGADTNGHRIRTIEYPHPKSKQLSIFVAEADLNQISRAPVSKLALQSRPDQKPFVINGKRYITPSKAAEIWGITPTGADRRLKKAEILGFQLEVISYDAVHPRLVSEDSVLALGDILKHNPLRPGPQRIRAHDCIHTTRSVDDPELKLNRR